MLRSSKKDNTSSKTKTPSAKPTSSTNGLNSLVNGTEVEGTIKSESDIRIDGKIQGKLLCNAKVIIGPTGIVDGEVNCKNAVIEGSFEGSLNVDELLNVRETAKINGEVSTNKLIIQSGAVFNVSCVMGAGGKSGSSPIILKDTGKVDGPGTSSSK